MTQRIFWFSCTFHSFTPRYISVTSQHYCRTWIQDYTLHRPLGFLCGFQLYSQTATNTISAEYNNRKHYWGKSFLEGTHNRQQRDIETYRLCCVSNLDDGLGGLRCQSLGRVNNWWIYQYSMKDIQIKQDTITNLLY